MRNAHKAVGSIPGWLIVGPKLRTIADGFLDANPHVCSAILASVTGEPDKRKGGVDLGDLELFRSLLSQNFGHCSTKAVSTESCSTEIRAALLRAIGSAAGDPGVFAADWLEQGAPAGVLCDPSADAIFPPSTDAPRDAPELLCRDEHNFSNYAGMDQDEAAYEELASFRDRSFFKEHVSLKAAQKAVGGIVYLFRYALLLRIKEGIEKRRIILDVK